MKNIIIIIIFCTTYHVCLAQNNIPSIKNNTALHYICKLHGQTRTLSLIKEKISDTLVFHLETRGVKSSIRMMPEAVKSGTELSFNQGENAPILVLKPTETFFMISQSAYQDLLKNDQFVYNNTTYVLDKSEETDPVIIDGIALSTLHVVAQIDNTEMWILQNPKLPLLCKMTKNPLGINFTLTDIVSE
ncbi:hypothetical protein [Thalassobellus suaedae]|uniref:DUF4412 domain-containing protein n=1 Tax=Thalassobellus suaedae TaxID=3074124 RepID=A0ABY9XZW4_9FLAO|nr:hypothetical protein RHP49_09595 [Flavobacteriaceae bacterium HL-DH10]